MKYSKKTISAFAVAIVATLAFSTSSVYAVVLFSDSFDRANSKNLDESLTGISDGTGASLTIDGVYSQPFVDPTNETTGHDGNAGNGGGSQILNNNLELALGAGTSNAYLNHNFTNASILSDGAFRVSVDILPGYGGGSAGQGGGFAVGMSQLNADMAGDASNGHPADGSAGSGPKFTEAFDVGGTAISDFWVSLRGDSTVVWGGFGDGNILGTAGIGDGVTAKTGTISATFGVTDFNAGSNVNYEVFYDGLSLGVGSFDWTESNANFIGLDARDGAVVDFDNLLIETTAPPSVPRLTIDRDTGNITFTNDTSQAVSLTVYSITSENGGFDQAGWDTIESQGIDTNDAWITLSDPASFNDISEGTLGEYTVGATGSANDSVDFGNAWIPSPFEDINVEIRDANGSDVPMIIEYIGDAIALGDYNSNGVIDAGDWPTIRDGLVSDVSGLSPIAAYMSGDINSDGFVNRADFRQFKEIYELANGAGSFAQISAVPEPSAYFLLTLSVIGMLLMKRRNLVVPAAVVCVALAATPEASAVNLFTDTFDRADNVNIDAETTGISGTVGTTLAADAVYQSNVDNVGGVDLTSNALRLAVGPGTSNVFVDHNFTDAAIVSDGGFSVSVDVTGFTSTNFDFGGAIAIGMTQIDAAASDDAFGGGVNGIKMTRAFGNIGSAVSDFWFAIRGNNSFAWGSRDTLQGVTTGLAANTGTISAKFATNGFGAGDSVGYEVFVDGASQGFGSFAWTNDMSNYIGVDGRDPAATQFDNLAIESVTDANINTLKLQVNTTSGAVSIVGGDAAANSLDYYEITSESLGLAAGSFTGLAGVDNGTFPAGDGSGNGWELNGVQSTSLLSESYLQSSSTVASGAAGVSLGAIYNTALDTQDIQFLYDLPDGTTQMGFIEYVSSSLPDFNGDGTVDAADYTVWRDNLDLMGGATLSQGDANGDGNVTSADYDIWVANYGASTSTTNATTVPEPTSLMCLLTGGLLAVVRRRGDVRN